MCLTDIASAQLQAAVEPIAGRPRPTSPEALLDVMVADAGELRGGAVVRLAGR